MKTCYGSLLLLFFLTPVPGIQPKTFTVSPGGWLYVETETGDLQVIPDQSDQVVIEVEGLKDPAEGLVVTQDGNNIRVSFRSDWSSRDLSFTARVPRRFNLNLRTAGGDVSLTGNLEGEVRATTAGGDISLADVEGPVQVRTAGGDIQAGKVQGEGSFHTSGGDVNVGTIQGQATLASSGGDILVERVGGSLSAKTGGGDVRVGDVSGGNASVATAGGDIELGKVSGQAQLRTSGGDIEIQSAQGAVSAVTAGGDLRLRGVVGSIQGTTSGGDVEAHLQPAGEQPSELKTSSGDIELVLPASARARIEVSVRGQQREEDENAIRSAFPAESMERTGREVRAVYLINGGGPLIRMNASNGRVSIRKGP